MFPLGDPDPWHWRTNEGSAIAFLVWVLLDDGLKASLFDVHPDGNGRLRSLGLDERSWRRGLGAMAGRHVAGYEAFDRAHTLPRHEIDLLRAAAIKRDPRKRRTLRAKQRALEQERGNTAEARMREAVDLTHAFEGSIAFREELAQAYQRWNAERRDVTVDGSSTVRQIGSFPPEDEMRRRQQLYEEFRNTSSRPPSLQVHVVQYPALVAEVIPPITLVLGVPLNSSFAQEESLLRDGFGRLSAQRP